MALEWIRENFVFLLHPSKAVETKSKASLLSATLQLILPVIFLWLAISLTSYFEYGRLSLDLLLLFLEIAVVLLFFALFISVEYILAHLLGGLATYTEHFYLFARPSSALLFIAFIALLLVPYSSGSLAGFLLFILFALILICAFRFSVDIIMRAHRLSLMKAGIGVLLPASLLIAFLLFLLLLGPSPPNPDMCSFPPGIFCNDVKISANQSSLSLSLRNGLSKPISVCPSAIECTDISPSQPQNKTGCPGQVEILVGEQKTVNATMPHPLCGAEKYEKVGTRFRGRIFLYYYFEGDTGNVRVTVGDVSTQVQP